jgi:glycosyltransferase involved in cell wall biosynthesis
MADPINVLLTDATDIFAGGEDYVLILGRYLARRSHNVWVSARPGHLLLRKCAEASLPVIPIEFGDMARVFGISRLLRHAMRDRAIAIVHSNANYDRTCAAIAAAFTGARHVAGIHSTHSIRHNITHALRNRYGTSHFITDADAGREVLLNEDGVPPWKVTTVPIGIESDPEDVRADFRARTREKMGIDTRTVVVGNVARLVPFKGHRFLLESAALIARENGNVLFLIAGDGELEADLKAQAASLGIGEAVRFLGFRDNLREIYPAFDVYCHSSIELASEMFPIAILRALASALPVVSTNVGGIAAMINEGVSGYLTPPEDPRALARALLGLVCDAPKRSALGRASFALFERRYHAAAMAANIERVYRHVMEGVQ